MGNKIMVYEFDMETKQQQKKNSFEEDHQCVFGSEGVVQYKYLLLDQTVNKYFLFTLNRPRVANHQKCEAIILGFSIIIENDGNANEL